MNRIVSFALGILSGLIGSAIWGAFGDKILKKMSGSTFTLSGIWLACFIPLSPEKSLSLELVRIIQRKDNVRLYIENYNNKRSKVIRLKGEGKYRSSSLVAIYYFIDKIRLDIGTFVLRTRGNDDAEVVIEGVYSQVKDRVEDDSTGIETENYELHQIDLPFRIRLRRLWQQTHFQSYSDLLNWLQSQDINPKMFKTKRSIKESFDSDNC